MLDQTLVSRCFTWKTVCLRKTGDSFTGAEYKECVIKALESLPDTDTMYEVIIKQENLGVVRSGVIELQTVIYWKGQ